MQPPTLIEQPLPHLSYRVALPEDAGDAASSTAIKPTVVMVHGRSGNEDVMWVFARSLPPNWLRVAPRALYEDPRGGYSWHVRLNSKWTTLAEFEPALDAFEAFIRRLPDEYGADLDNLHLMGFSQGAALSLGLAMRGEIRPKSITALVGFMPDACSPNDLAHLRDLPIHFAVGREDDTIPLDVSHSAAQLLVAANSRLNYRTYATGHKLNAQGMRDLKAWWQAIAATYPE